MNSRPPSELSSVGTGRRPLSVKKGDVGSVLPANLPEARIRSEAASLFSEHGVASASMRMVAERLGVTKAALYHYFPSKEQLHFEIHLEALDDALEQLRSVRDADHPAPAKIEAVCTLILSSIAERRDVYTVLLREGTRLEPEHWSLLKEKSDQYRLLVEEILTEGNETGELAVADPPAASLALLGMCNWAYTWLRPEGRLSVSELARQFSGIVLHGILSSDETPTAGDAGPKELPMSGPSES